MLDGWQSINWQNLAYSYGQEVSNQSMEEKYATRTKFQISTVNAKLADENFIEGK